MPLNKEGKDDTKRNRQSGRGKGQINNEGPPKQVQNNWQLL